MNEAEEVKNIREQQGCSLQEARRIYVRRQIEARLHEAVRWPTSHGDMIAAIEMLADELLGPLR